MWPFSTLNTLELLRGLLFRFTVALASTTYQTNCHQRKKFPKRTTTRSTHCQPYRTLTCFQFLELPAGSLVHLFTSRTHALQISPERSSQTWKQPLNCASYFVDAVNRELDDFAPQIQHPKRDRNTFGRCDANILLKQID